MYSKKSQFTLTELLIVVVIMGILVALLLPMLFKAKIAANKVLCISQLRQNVLAANIYAKDNEAHYPSRIKNNGQYSSHGYPHQMKRTSNGNYNLNTIYLKPYAGENQLLFCPGQSFNNGLDDVAYTTQDVEWSTYQYFVWGGYGSYYWQPRYPRVDFTKITTIINPSEASLWACKLQNRHGVPNNCHPKTGNKLLGQNAGFADGSSRWVEWENIELVWRYGTDKFYWPKYND